MTADLQDLFDQAGRNPPTRALDADAVLRRARRSRNRRTIGAVAATVAVTLALVVGLASQRRLSADPVPAAPLPTVQALGSLGRLAYGIDGDIYVADADGRNPVRIADGAPSEAGDCGGYWGEGPIWSPDGRYLAYRGDGGEAGDRARVTGPSTSATRRATASHRSPVRGGPSRGRPTPPGSLRGSTSTGMRSLRSTGSTGCARRCSPCRPTGLRQATSTRCGHPMARRFWSPAAWRSPSTGPRRGSYLWTTPDRS